MARAAAADLPRPGAVAHFRALRAALAAPATREVECLAGAGGQRQQHAEGVHVDRVRADGTYRGARAQDAVGVERERELHLGQLARVAEAEVEGIRPELRLELSPRGERAPVRGQVDGRRARPSG